MDSEQLSQFFQVIASLAGMLTALVYLGRAWAETHRPKPQPPLVVPPAEEVVRPIVVPAVEAALIGPRLESYARRFRRFEARGATRFSLSWNWGAFFLNGFWFLYRKVYGFGLFFLVLFAGAAGVARFEAKTPTGELARYALLPIALAAATIANYVYFRTVARRARELRAWAGADEAKAVARAREVGGVDPKALVAAVLVFAIVGAFAVVTSSDVLYNQTRRFVRQSWRAMRRMF